MFSWVAASAWVLNQRIQPAPDPVGHPPADFQALEPVEFTTSDGWKLSGWQAHATRKESTVILLHQYKANRWAMMTRARLLHSLGYGVLLYDARGCGESEGDRVSLGIHEVKDVSAAYSFLQDQGIEYIGAWGRSQGAATILLSGLPFETIVLESCYDQLRTSFRRRMETHLGVYLPGSDTALWWLARYRLGFEPDEASPLTAAAHAAMPKLFLAGTREKRLPTVDTQRLYDSAPEPKILWWVEGAAHEDFLQ
jgi:fermentation-respiration switch protein FrsA (DUF1100 family)